MKKLALLLALVMVVSALTGCGNKVEPVIQEPTKEIEKATVPVISDPVIPNNVGGWSVSNASSEIPEKAQQAFDKAFNGFVGVGYEPIAYLGSQVVAGTNYAFLCKGTTVTANPITNLYVIIVYNHFSGEASVKSIEEFNIADYNK